MSDSKRSIKDVVAEVKSAYLISDYVRASGVKLTPNGSDKWKGLCQFHQEKTPSFSVSDHFQNYRCWGCGATGDLVNYVMQTESLDFIEALKKLAEDKGISVELSGDESGVDYKALRECLKESANFFVREFRKLPEDHAAKQQVLSRGLTLNKMHYGYAPEKRTALYDHLKSLKFSDEVILAAGVATKWEDTGKFSDFWSGRLMFVITEATGKPIGFAGRKLFEGDKRGKFVNSQAGPLFDKSSALFNIQNAKKPASELKEVYVAEGQFDVAAFIEADLPNVVAASGTAFTSRQGQILQRLVGESGKVLFAFDGDEAGVGAALKVFKNAPSLHSSAYVVAMPEGKDPCDLRLELGSEALKTFAETERVSLIDFVLDSTAKSYDLTNSMDRVKYLEQAARILKTVAAQGVRESFVRRVALATVSDVATVRALVSEAEPLDLQAIEKVAEERAPEVRQYSEEEPTLKSEELIEKIKTDSLYELSARFVALAFVFPELIAFLPKNKVILPSDFHQLVDDTVKLDSGARIMPELFTDDALASHLIETNFFPLAHLETFDPKAHFLYLFKAIKAVEQEEKRKSVQSRMAKLLNDSPQEGAAFLREIIQREEAELGAA